VQGLPKNELEFVKFDSEIHLEFELPTTPLYPDRQDEHVFGVNWQGSLFSCSQKKSGEAEQLTFWKLKATLLTA
jgi:hypothetical protein